MAEYNVTSQNTRRSGQGALVTANAENERIKTVTYSKATDIDNPSHQSANVPTEDAENKRIAKDTYRGQNDTDGNGKLEDVDHIVPLEPVE